MTPEREAYLLGISNRERVIRHAIRMAARSLRETKEWWTKHKTTHPNKIRGYKTTIKRHKLTLMACRRELARLKGMDRVGRAVVIDFEGPYGYELYSCKDCKETLYSRYSFCPTCGRRILWEKVK